MYGRDSLCHCRRQPSWTSLSASCRLFEFTVGSFLNAPISDLPKPSHNCRREFAGDEYCDGFSHLLWSGAWTDVPGSSSLLSSALSLC
jgi:hypothetical protein